MKRLLLFIILTALLSCDRKLSENTFDKPYFDFDKVEHYKTNLSIDSIDQIGARSKTTNELALLQIVKENVPANINDTLFVRNMKILGFEKKQMNPELNSEISSIFTERKSHSLVALDAASCITYFRDILIFRKSNKIVGVAKICFTCNQYLIIGSKGNTNSFGEYDEFERIKKIL